MKKPCIGCKSPTEEVCSRCTRPLCVECIAKGGFCRDCYFAGLINQAKGKTDMRFYTITHDGQEYAAVCPHYQWKKVTEYFGIDREHIRRGAKSTLKPWPGKEEPEKEGNEKHE